MSCQCGAPPSKIETTIPKPMENNKEYAPLDLALQGFINYKNKKDHFTWFEKMLVLIIIIIAYCLYQSN